MPTTLPRTTITHVPRVQRLLDKGHQRWPDAPPRDILINLAEERVSELLGEPSPAAAPRPTTFRSFRALMASTPVDDDILSDIGVINELFAAREDDPWGDG